MQFWFISKIASSILGPFCNDLAIEQVFRKFGPPYSPAIEGFLLLILFLSSYALEYSSQYWATAIYSSRGESSSRESNSGLVFFIITNLALKKDWLLSTLCICSIRDSIWYYAVVWNNFRTAGFIWSKIIFILNY